MRLLSPLLSDGRRFPLIFLVVEDRRIGHVIRRIDRRLDREDAFRVAHVLRRSSGISASGRISSERSSPASARSDRAAPRVERHRALIGVDDDLHRVADVVHAADEVEYG
jgi:hypothetical protein